jgi:hypothetical protein
MNESPLTGTTMHRMSLAKEMFMLGKHQSRKNSDIARMSTVLNFDFAVTSLIVACMVDRKINVKTKYGKTLKWHELILSFKKIYNDETFITDLDNLHELRNSIQHGNTIPSDSDIERYSEIVFLFFQDVCLKVFKNKITYNSISMTHLLKSSHERILLLMVEKNIETKNYPHALYFIHLTTLYHYALLKTNLTYPILPFEILTDPRRSSIKDLYLTIHNVVDKLAFGEHYLKTKELLKTAPPYFTEFEANKYDIFNWLSNLTVNRIDISYEEIEQQQVEIFNIIFETEKWLTEKYILDVPIIYNLQSSTNSPNSVTIKFDIFNKLPIESAWVELFDKVTNTFLISKPIPNDETKITLTELNPNIDYLYKIYVMQSPDPEFRSNKHINFAVHSFRIGNSL